MLFLISTSFQLLVLVLASPVGWILVPSVVAASPLVRLVRRSRFVSTSAIDFSTVRFASEATLLAIVPIAILIFGAVFWRDWQTAPAHTDESLLLQALNGLSLLQLAALGWFFGGTAPGREPPSL